MNSHDDDPLTDKERAQMLHLERRRRESMHEDGRKYEQLAAKAELVSKLWMAIVAAVMFIIACTIYVKSLEAKVDALSKDVTTLQLAVVEDGKRIQETLLQLKDKAERK